MKYLLYWLLLVTPSIYSCSGRPPGTLLPATAFSEKIQNPPDALLLDVRTPEEFAKGHVPNARNVDWNGTDFEERIASMDKTKPVYVYCLSGTRSAEAAAELRAEGFQSVFELQGGIMKWRGANLPESQDNPAKTAGISAVEYAALLQSSPVVLVDFYADWCEPCKKMAPYLEAIKIEMAGKVPVIRINADDNQQIVKQLGIDALPVLLIYKNGRESWRNAGFLDKPAVEAKLAEFK